MAIEDLKKRAEYNKIGVIFLGYAFLCFITSFWFDLNVGKATLVDSTPAKGGIIGPLHVKERNTVYLITISQDVDNGAWSFVSGDVLDENKNYLFGFGGEFWEESGRDSDGTWHENKENYNLKVTFPEKGIFYLSFESQMKTLGSGGNIKIKVEEKRGSALAHFVLGVFSIVAASGILLYANAEASG
jgi:hypothetical protein